MTSKYDRAKGTKKEQGIETPKKDKFFKCGCVFKHDLKNKSYILRVQCQDHSDKNAPTKYDKFLVYLQPKKSKKKKK